MAVDAQPLSVNTDKDLNQNFQIWHHHKTCCHWFLSSSCVRVCISLFFFSVFPFLKTSFLKRTIPLRPFVMKLYFLFFVLCLYLIVLLVYDPKREHLFVFPDLMSNIQIDKAYAWVQFSYLFFTLRSFNSTKAVAERTKKWSCF